MTKDKEILSNATGRIVQAVIVCILVGVIGWAGTNISSLNKTVTILTAKVDYLARAVEKLQDKKNFANLN